MKKVVIFDMNGVIVNDENVHFLAFQNVLNNLGVDLSEESYNIMCLGKTDKAGFENIIKFFNLKDIRIEDLLENKSQKYLDLVEGNIETYPGLLEMVNDLSRKYVLALASGANSLEIKKITEYFKIKDFFKVIISAEDVKNGKPDPEPYLLTAERLGVLPEDCFVIEDSRSGVSSAKSAGMVCIAITTNLAKEDFSEADYVFEDFFKMREFLLNF